VIGYDIDPVATFITQIKIQDDKVFIVFFLCIQYRLIPVPFSVILEYSNKLK